MSCRAQIQPSNKFLLVIFAAEHNQNPDWEIWVLTDNRRIWVKKYSTVQDESKLNLIFDFTLGSSSNTWRDPNSLLQIYDHICCLLAKEPNILSMPSQKKLVVKRKELSK